MVSKFTKKVCLLGDFGAGKTSLVRSFVEGCFDERYLSTIGVKVDRKVLTLPAASGEVVLTMMLWDLAGGPDLGPAAGNYVRGAAGAVIVCDLTRRETLASAGEYVRILQQANPKAQRVLAANKVDLVEEQRLSAGELEEVAAWLGAPLFFTSAKTGEQLEAMFAQLGALVLAA